MATSSDIEQPRAAEPQRARRRLRIVFALLHPGYLRHYGQPIRILAARGHSVHLAFYREEQKDVGDALLLKRLLEDCPTVTAGRAPRRRHVDGWRPLAWMVRALVDVLRYAEPRYDDAVALRGRTAQKLRTRVASSLVDPLTRTLIQRVLDWIAGRGDPDRARRASRLLLRIEAAIPSSRRIERLLVSYGADVVLASPVVEIGSPQVEFVKSARRLGIPCAVCVASWDNLTNKGLLRVVPDRVLVWNDTQRRELEEMHGIAPDRVVLTGGQKFDAWFARRPSTTREQFATMVGLDPAKPYVLYLCSSAFIAPDEVSFVRRWLAALRSSPSRDVSDVGVLVRPHPQNAAQWAGIDLSEFGAVAIWPRAAEYPDEAASQATFFDSIAHSVAVVGVNTSAQIEAAIVARPVLTVRDPAFAKTQDGTLHFHYLLREHGGFVRAAASLDEHLEQLAATVADPRAGDDARRFVETFVRPRGIDRPAAPIVADEIEAVAVLTPGRRRPGSELLLRVALYPLVAAMSVAAAAAALRYRWRRASAPTHTVGGLPSPPRAPSEA